MCKAKRIASATLAAALALATGAVSAGPPAQSSVQSESGATAAPSTERLARLVQGAPIGHPEPTPVAGIFRVRIGSDYVYLTSDGQYAFSGSLVDLSTGENLISATDSAWEARRRIRVPGLRDNACKAAVERALTDVDGVLRVSVDPEKSRVVVDYLVTKTDYQSLEGALEAAGVPPAAGRWARFKSGWYPEPRREGPGQRLRTRTRVLQQTADPALPDGPALTIRGSDR